MAKENKLNPFLLFGISASLLCLGWLMKSFPVFTFAAIAPLFAITDHSRNEDRFWNLTELILAALALGLFAAHVFEMHFLVISLIQAIALTLAFLGYSFVYHRLGSWVGKFIIIIFWMAIEYAFLKSPWRENFIFLADAFSLKPEWLTWNHYTGYLGTSLWILVANLLFYLTFLGGKKIYWLLFIITILWITGPIVLSYWREGAFISRTDMILLYNHKNLPLHQNYIYLGEVISSVAAGMSVVILLIAAMRKKDQKQ